MAWFGLVSFYKIPELWIKFHETLSHEVCSLLNIKEQVGRPDSLYSVRTNIPNCTHNLTELYA